VSHGPARASRCSFKRQAPVSGIPVKAIRVPGCEPGPLRDGRASRAQQIDHRAVRARCSGPLRCIKSARSSRALRRTRSELRGLGANGGAFSFEVAGPERLPMGSSWQREPLGLADGTVFCTSPGTGGVSTASCCAAFVKPPITMEND
jgi:hypothetical protein